MAGLSGATLLEGTEYDREGRVSRRRFGSTMDPAGLLDERLFHDAGARSPGWRW